MNFHLDIFMGSMSFTVALFSMGMFVFFWIIGETPKKQTVVRVVIVIAALGAYPVFNFLV